MCSGLGTGASFSQNIELSQCLNINSFFQHYQCSTNSGPERERNPNSENNSIEPGLALITQVGAKCPEILFEWKFRSLVKWGQWGQKIISRCKTTRRTGNCVVQNRRTYDRGRHSFTMFDWFNVDSRKTIILMRNKSYWTKVNSLMFWLYLFSVQNFESQIKTNKTVWNSTRSTTLLEAVNNTLGSEVSMHFWTL